jgi:hypothetical protein
MGEIQGTLFSPDFNRSIQIEARPERLSADAGALLLRDLTDRLGLPGLIRRHLKDPRDPDRITHPILELLRTWVLLLAHDWRDQADATLLREDPILRLAVSTRRGQSPLRPSESSPEGLCSQATLSRLLHTLAREDNLMGLGEIVREIVFPALDTGRKEITLDLDSFPHPVHGHQPGAAYNSHYGVTCFHPLIASVEGRYFLGARLREGNVHTADGGLDFALPLLRWLQGFIPNVWLRADAGFPAPRFLDSLEKEGFPYVCRLRSNQALDRLAEPFLERAAGRPPNEHLWTHELSYRAGTWTRSRRVVLVIVEHPDAQGSLFLDHFFLLTNAPPEEEGALALLERYRQRGCAESDFGAFKTTLAPTLSSTPREKSHYRGCPVTQDYAEPDTFAANEAKLHLALLSANVLALGADLLSRGEATRMSRERFRTLVLKSAARVLLSGHRVTVILQASRAALWQRFRAMLLDLYPTRGSPRLQAPLPHA